MIRGISCTALASLFLAGCAINQVVKPVEPFAGTQVCIVVNPAVSQAGFLATYSRILAFADIKVFSNGQQSGQAVYDALRGGANMNKFIKGEAKIAELVNQLFPGRARDTL